MQAAAIQALFARHGFDHIAILPVPLPINPNDWIKRTDQLIADGIGDMQWLVKQRALRCDPRYLMAQAQSVIVTLLPYHPDTVAADSPPIIQRARYASGKDYHQLLRKKLMNAGNELLHQLGQVDADIRATVDSAPVDERSLAVLAGLGWRGRNGLIIHPRRGSYHFLAELWCSVPLPEIDGASNNDRCGTCHNCEIDCPTKALTQRRVLSERCISYLTIEHHGVIPRELAIHFNGWWFGCDRCQEVCPWNRFAKPAGDSRLLGRDDSLDLLLRLTATGFDQHFAGSAVRRIGYVRFRRNILVALFSQQQTQLLDHFAADPETLIQSQLAELAVT